MSLVHERLLALIKEAAQQALAAHDMHSAEVTTHDSQSIITRNTTVILLDIVDTAYELGKLAGKEPEQ